MKAGCRHEKIRDLKPVQHLAKNSLYWNPMDSSSLARSPPINRFEKIINRNKPKTERIVLFEHTVSDKNVEIYDLRENRHGSAIIVMSTRDQAFRTVLFGPLVTYMSFVDECSRKGNARRHNHVPKTSEGSTNTRIPPLRRARLSLARQREDRISRLQCRLQLKSKTLCCETLDPKRNRKKNKARQL